MRLAIPPLFIPHAWLDAAHTLPRGSAALLFIICISMLVLGLRFARGYVLLAVLVAGWIGGTLLAQLMHVTSWYVALPAALIAAALMWPLSQRVMPLCIGFATACGVGSFLSAGLGLTSFWVGFSIGAVAGVALGFLAPRFSTAVFFSLAGVVGGVALLGPMVRAASGPFAPRGYDAYSLVFLVGGAVVFIASLIVQVVLDPELRS